MLVYLDLCCFNRPFDDQSHPRVQLETEAKLLIQQQVKGSVIGLAWSFMLAYENSANPDIDVSASIANWEHLAAITVEPHQEIIEQAKKFQQAGIDSKDALHISCAVAAKAQYFITVDKGILKHRDGIAGVHIRSPLEFVEQED